MREITTVSDRNYIKEFLDNFTSEATKKAYENDIRDFLSYFSDQFDQPKHPIQFNISHFIAYRDFLIKTGLTTASVVRKVSSLKSLMNWCVSSGLINSNPLTHLRLPKVITAAPTQAFTDSEVKAMIAVPDNTYYGNMHKLMLSMLFYLGLRRSELVNIKLNDFYEDRGALLLKITGKGGKERILPIGEDIRSCIESYKAALIAESNTILGNEDYLLQSYCSKRNVSPMDAGSVLRIVKSYAKRAGITRRVSPHSCRATVISHLLEKGVSPRDVADFAGHSNINTTVSIYDKKRNIIHNSAASKVIF